MTKLSTFLLLAVMVDRKILGNMSERTVLLYMMRFCKPTWNNPAELLLSDGAIFTDIRFKDINGNQRYAIFHLIYFLDELYEVVRGRYC